MGAKDKRKVNEWSWGALSNSSETKRKKKGKINKLNNRNKKVNRHGMRYI